MLKYVVSILIKEVVEALFKAAKDYLALQKKKKEDKQSVKEALDEKDPKARAARIADLLK